MSSHTQTGRITVPMIKARKGREPIVSLTCYHAHTARLLDNYVDMMLVGDSLGMVMHGLETTLGVTLEMMILHAQAVMRGSKRVNLVVVRVVHSGESGDLVEKKDPATLFTGVFCHG